MYGPISIVLLRSRSVNVFAGPGSASPPIKFLLTRNQHLKHRNGGAWRILLEATDSKQLRLEAPAGGNLFQVAAER